MVAQPSIFKEVKYFTVYAHEWEAFVEKFYSVTGYCYDCIEETGHDDVKTFSVRKEELSDWDKRQLEDLKNCSTYTLLTDLCNKDTILSGNYQITTL